MKKKAGINAAAWFYAQPGFHAPCRGLDCGVDLQSGKWVCREGSQVSDNSDGQGMAGGSGRDKFQAAVERIGRAEAERRIRDFVGTRELPDSPRHGDYGHVCNETCDVMLERAYDFIERHTECLSSHCKCSDREPMSDGIRNLAGEIMLRCGVRGMSNVNGHLQDLVEAKLRVLVAGELERAARIIEASGPTPNPLDLAAAVRAATERDSLPGACGPERTQSGNEAQQAPDGSGHSWECGCFQCVGPV